MNIETFNPIANIREARQLARVYADVFAAEPWLEVTKCLSEGKFYGVGTKAGGVCSCGSILGEAYPEDDTLQYVINDSQRPSALMLVARDERKIVGFSWGYVYKNAGDFTREKYRDPLLQRQIAMTLDRSGAYGRLYYFSETGIVPEYRGNGTTNDFYQKRMDLAEQLMLPIVVRTNRVSPIVAVALKFGFSQVLGPEVKLEDKKIIETGRVVNDLVDLENPDRVLFVAKPKSYPETVDWSRGCLR